MKITQNLLNNKLNTVN